MGKLINKTQGNFTIVNNNILRNKELGSTERGLLITLIGLPDGWNLSVAGLCAIMPDGKDKISRTLKKLEALGYLKIIPVRTTDGRFTHNDYEIYDEPHKDIIDEKPSAENPSTDSPIAENDKLLSNNIYNNNILNTDNVCVNDDELKHNGTHTPTPISTSEYETLIAKYTKPIVDAVIERVKSHNYHVTNAVITEWCAEHYNRSKMAVTYTSNKNQFNNHTQREYDFDEIERTIWSNGADRVVCAR